MQIKLKDLIQQEEKLVNMASEDVATLILCGLDKAKQRKLGRLQLRFPDLQKKRSYFAGVTTISTPKYIRVEYLGLHVVPYNDC